MQRTKSKILSILLSLVMLLSLVPAMGVTALAAAYYGVGVNGIELRDGYYLENNSSEKAKTGATTAPTTYVAWYKDGVLTLNKFTGKANSSIVVQGADAGELTIKLIGENTITPYETGIQGNSNGGSITITADSGSDGKLTIDMTNSTRPVFGINGYENSVTITGSADVTINAEATATNRESYGIKSSKAVSILDSASVSITCKTPNNSGRSDSCNGIFSEKNVTINTGGTIQIDVSDAGKEAYSYGINSMDTLTLTKVGGMTVKWKKAGVQGAPLLPSSASFNPNAYVTNVTNVEDTTNWIATYTPKGTTTNISVSGTIKSYGDASDAVTVTLTKQGETKPTFTDTPTGASGTAPYSQNYSFSAVPAGDYTLKVEKKGHAPWTENITVGSADVTKDVTIYLIGDVNGDGTIDATDMQRIYAHISGENTFSNSAQGDVNKDGNVDATDMQRIYAHISGENLLS